MSEAFDVIVVGARCAGSSLAALLARSGVKVCVLDKDSFPSDTPSTHAVQPVGVRVLDRLGVLNDLTRVSPPLRSGRLIFDDAVARVPDIEGITGSYVISARRGVMDELLAEAARKSGAEVRTETRVLELVTERGRVAGVRTPEGELRSRMVIGADGTHSFVARAVGAEEYYPTENGRLFMWAYYEADPTGGEMWIGKRADWAYLVTPCDSGLCLVGACPSIGRRDEARGNREGVYEEGIRAWPELAEGVTGAQREGGVHTMANMHGFFRESAGAGWALVGDAGHFKDPTPGQGIADALRQSEKLAGEIERALGAETEADADRILADWWRWRDEDAWEMYWFAHDLGVSGPTPPLLAEIQRRVAASRELTDATVRVFNHEVEPSEVFTRGFALKALGGAIRSGRGVRRQIVREAVTAAMNEARRARAAKGLPIRS